MWMDYMDVSDPMDVIKCQSGQLVTQNLSAEARLQNCMYKVFEFIDVYY